MIAGKQIVTKRNCHSLFMPPYTYEPGSGSFTSMRPLQMEALPDYEYKSLTQPHLERAAGFNQGRHFREFA